MLTFQCPVHLHLLMPLEILLQFVLAIRSVVVASLTIIKLAAGRKAYCFLGRKWNSRRHMLSLIILFIHLMHRQIPDIKHDLNMKFGTKTTKYYFLFGI